jgi:large subunit ribosomal protein L16
LILKAPKTILYNYLQSTKSARGYGLRALETSRVFLAEIEACKKIAKKILKKRGRLLCRVYTGQPLTKKPGETRMGKGKSSRVTNWVCNVKTGGLMFELRGLPRSTALSVLRRLVERLHINTKIIALRK